METIIIQDAVVAALCSGTLVIDFFIFLRAAWDFCIKADAPFGFRFYDAAIFGLGTVTAAFIGMTFAIWTAPHKFPTVPVKSIWHHTEASLASRGSILIDPDCIRYGFGVSAFAVQVNKSPDLPVL